MYLLKSKLLTLTPLITEKTELQHNTKDTLQPAVKQLRSKGSVCVIYWHFISV